MCFLYFSRVHDILITPHNHTSTWLTLTTHEPPQTTNKEHKQTKAPVQTAATGRESVKSPSTTISYLCMSRRANDMTAWLSTWSVVIPLMTLLTLITRITLVTQIGGVVLQYIQHQCIVNTSISIYTTPTITTITIGNFDSWKHAALPVTQFDKIIDTASPNPGHQTYEKMLSGTKNTNIVILLILLTLESNHPTNPKVLITVIRLLTIIPIPRVITPIILLTLKSLLPQQR